MSSIFNRRPSCSMTLINGGQARMQGTHRPGVFGGSTHRGANRLLFNYSFCSPLLSAAGLVFLTALHVGVVSLLASRALHQVKCQAQTCKCIGSPFWSRASPNPTLVRASTKPRAQRDLVLLLRRLLWRFARLGWRGLGGSGIGVAENQVAIQIFLLKTGLKRVCLQCSTYWLEFDPTRDRR